MRILRAREVYWKNWRVMNLSDLQKIKEQVSIRDVAESLLHLEKQDGKYKYPGERLRAFSCIQTLSHSMILGEMLAVISSNWFHILKE